MGGLGSIVESGVSSRRPIIDDYRLVRGAKSG